MLAVIPQRLCDFRPGPKVLVLPVHGNRVLGLHQGVDELDFLLAGVARHMDILEDDLGPLVVELVDDPGHGLLVARNRVRGEDDRVVGLDADLLVHPRRHAGQGRHGLALGTRRNQAGPLVREVLQLVHGNQGIGRDADVAELGGGVDDVHHGAAFDHALAPVLVGGIDDLLNPVHIGCEGRNDDPGVRIVRKDIVEGPSDRALGLGEAWPLRVRRIAAEGQNPLLPDFGKTLQVNLVSEDRRVIDLEVAGMDDRPGRRIDGQGRCILNRVICLNELYPETARVDGLTEGNHLAADLRHHIFLFELVLNDAHGKLRGIEGHRQLVQDIGNRPDMVFMSVGDENALDLVFILDQKGNIGYDKVDPRHVVLGERHSAVNDDDTVAVAESCHIHSDEFNAAQGNDLQLLFSFFLTHLKNNLRIVQKFCENLADCGKLILIRDSFIENA